MCAASRTLHLLSFSIAENIPVRRWLPPIRLKMRFSIQTSFTWLLFFVSRASVANHTPKKAQSVAFEEILTGKRIVADLLDNLVVTSEARCALGCNRKDWLLLNPTSEIKNDLHFDSNAARCPEKQAYHFMSLLTVNL